MCANDPVWIDFLIREGKQAVDAGTDFFNIDEIQGNGVALWAALGQIGLCDDCLSEWRRYLRESFTEVELQDRFQIASLAEEDFVERFRRTGNLLDYRKRTAADPLVAEFIRFQQRANFRCKKHVIQTIRPYAAERNRPIAITANVAWLDVYEVVGTWFRGLAFADLLDFITFECFYQPDGAKARAHELVLLPRGKWLAFYRLARAATGTSPLGLLAANHQPSFEKLVGRRDRYHYLEEGDDFVEQTNVEVSLKIPENFAEPSSAAILSPDFASAESVDVEVVGGRLRIVIPSLKVYSIVVVQRQDPK